jgi:PAS domain S-box-containing protein
MMTREELAIELETLLEASRASPGSEEHQRAYQILLELQARELIETRARAERSTLRLVEFFESLPVPCCVVDGVGRIRDVNRVAVKLLGDERTAVLGKKLIDLVGSSNPDAVRRFLASSVELPGECELEGARVPKPDSVLRLSGIPLIEDDQKWVRIVLEDVTVGRSSLGLARGLEEIERGVRSAENVRQLLQALSTGLVPLIGDVAIASFGSVIVAAVTDARRQAVVGRWQFPPESVLHRVAGWMRREKLPRWVEPKEAVPGGEWDLSIGLPDLGSFALAPLRAAKGRGALLVSSRRSARRLGPLELGVCVQLAKSVSYALDRLPAEPEPT